MLPIELTRREQSRAHLLLLRALNTDGEPRTPDDATKHAFAEICAMHLNRPEHSISEIFQLAEKILWFRDEKYPNCGVVFDVNSLCECTGASKATAILSVRLCGAMLIGTRWADDESAKQKLTFEDMQWQP